MPEVDTESVDRRHTSGDGGQILLEISNRVVRIHKEFYGKGPTKARTQLSRDMLTVLLEGGFTRGERTLRDSGHARVLADSRHAMQKSVERDLVEAIEETTGRRVRSFMSANDPDAELQVEIFVLEREDGDGAGQNGASQDGAARDGAGPDRFERAIDRSQGLRRDGTVLGGEPAPSRDGG